MICIDKNRKAVPQVEIFTTPLKVPVLC